MGPPGEFHIPPPPATSPPPRPCRHSRGAPSPTVPPRDPASTGMEGLPRAGGLQGRTKKLGSSLGCGGRRPGSCPSLQSSSLAGAAPKPQRVPCCDDLPPRRPHSPRAGAVIPDVRTAALGGAGAGLAAAAVGRPGEGRRVSSSCQGRGRGAGGGPSWGAVCCGLGPGSRTPLARPSLGSPRQDPRPRLSRQPRSK